MFPGSTEVGSDGVLRLDFQRPPPLSRLSVADVEAVIMDATVVSSVRSCLERWAKGGEDEWSVLSHTFALVKSSFANVFMLTNGSYKSSRNIVTSPHCNITEPECVDVLAIVYETLLHAMLSTWSPAPTEALLPVASFVSFVRSVLDSLPSTSTPTPPSSQNSPHRTLFGELLVDLVWSIDSDLDELLADASS